MLGGTSQLPTNTSGLLKRQTPLEPILWQNVQVHIVTEWTWTWKFLTCDFWRDQWFCPGSYSKPRPPPPCTRTISPTAAQIPSSGCALGPPTRAPAAGGTKLFWPTRSIRLLNVIQTPRGTSDTDLSEAHLRRDLARRAYLFLGVSR